MELIYANRPGTLARGHRPLTPEERQGLVAHYVDGITTTFIEALLASTWRSRYWIACDCRGSNSPAPIFFVRRSAQDRYILMRMPDRPPHRSNCPYNKPSAVACMEESKDTLLTELQQLLFRWFGAARLNVLYPYDAEDLVRSQYASLREVAKSLYLAPGRSLFDYSCTHPSGLPELLKRLGDCAAESRHAPPTGIYLTIVGTMADTELRAALIPRESHDTQCSVSFDSLEKPFGTDADPGPYALMVEFAFDVGLDRTRPRRCLVQPVYSRRHLIPVQGPYERRTLQVLLRVQKTLLESHQAVVSIRKTLPGAPLQERGIAFQLQRLGPNGRPVRELDVLCVNGANSSIPTESTASADVLYHWIQNNAGSSADSDYAFASSLMKRLLEGLGTRVRTRAAEG